MFRVKYRELSLISGAIRGFFETLGSYRTPHLGDKR